MTAKRSIWILFAACMIVAGCGKGGAEPADFGAKMVASQIVEAQNKCAAARAGGLEACEASSVKEARMAAKTANYMIETYNRACADDFGLTKCEELLTSAYERSRPKAASWNVR